MPEWLELELAEELRPAPAPDELWDRVRRANGPPARNRTAWPIAAIVTLMIAAATLWLVARGEEPPLDLHQLAIEQLRDRAPLDIRSSDPVEIGHWMRAQAGVEIALPAQSGARLIGARAIQQGGTRIGALSYLVGGDTATLLVARAGPSIDSGHGRPLWKARGQTFALACSNPDRPEAACLLCHSL